jgi:gamma-glutamylcyclotransferase (GGCT)/AIG2-like uncharacterized protein YtfP
MSTSNSLGLVLGVFVYGTLKRGQCREHCWPVPPSKIFDGYVLGTLYGRSDYPALVAGADRVIGELWCYDTALDRVVQVLDEIEETNQVGVPDLYKRAIVQVHSLDGNLIGPAYTYHYAQDLKADGFSYHMPVEGWSRWP